MSNYIAVDLKVIEVLAPMVARAASITEDRALAGLVRLWHRCWSTKSDTLTLTQLAGIFGGERIAEVAEVLCADFLEHTTDGYRARGVEKYLRIDDAKSAAGKVRAASAGRSAGRFTSRPPAQHQHTTSIPPALSPNTEHRTPNTKEEKLAPAARAPRESDRLLADFQELIGSRYVYGGEKDAVAFAALRKTETLDEVSKRWRRGLSATGFLGVRTLAELRSKWNHLAQEPNGSPKAPAPVADWSNAVSGEIPA